MFQSRINKRWKEYFGIWAIAGTLFLIFMETTNYDPLLSGNARQAAIWGMFLASLLFVPFSVALSRASDRLSESIWHD